MGEPARRTSRATAAGQRATLEAIRAGDAEEARESCRRHRQRGGRELIALIERSGLAWL